MFSEIEESLVNVPLSPSTSRVHTKRPMSHEDPIGDLPDDLAQSLVADEIQRRIVEPINHNINDTVNTLWTRIEQDRSSERSPIMSGYEKLPRNLFVVQNSQNASVSECECLRSRMAESILLVQQQQERRNVLISQQQVVNESLSSRMRSIEHPSQSLRDHAMRYISDPVAPPLNVIHEEQSSASTFSPFDHRPEQEHSPFVQPGVHPMFDGPRNGNDRNGIGNENLIDRREMRLRKLNPPPKFDSRHLNAWIRDVRYWRELYSTIDELQILSALGLNASEDLKEILMNYFEDTKDTVRNRSLESFLLCVRKEFGAIQEIERMGRLNDLMAFKR